MGFRWRKQVRKGPLSINLSKRGVGWSLGFPGFRFGIGADGKLYFSLGLLGTGHSSPMIQPTARSLVEIFGEATRAWEQCHPFRFS